MNLFPQNSHLSYNEPIEIEPIEKTSSTKTNINATASFA